MVLSEQDFLRKHNLFFYITDNGTCLHDLFGEIHAQSSLVILRNQLGKEPAKFEELYFPNFLAQFVVKSTIPGVQEYSNDVKNLIALSDQPRIILFRNP